MYATIQKWGNSQAIRLPKGLLEVATFHENDKVEINAEKDCIVIKRANKKHKTLEERLAGYNDNYQVSEWDTGESQGNEV
jgi:antitoxin MazE